jgi:hypothetical protein
MEFLAYTPREGRLQTLTADLTAENTTWFKDNGKTGDVASISDLAGGLLIRTLDHNYPLWMDGLSREDIGHSRSKAREIHHQETK